MTWLAPAMFLLFTAGHWVALPILVTWDGYEYVELADVLDGHRYPEEWRPVRGFLFPLALKIAYALFGRSPISTTAVTTAAAILGCFLLAALVRRIAGNVAAAVLLLLLAVFPSLVAFEHIPLTETGTFFFIALGISVYAWTPPTPRGRWIGALLQGLVLAAGFYWRSTILFIAPLFALLQLVPRADESRSRNGLRAAVVILLPVLLALPWMLHFSGRLRSGYTARTYALGLAVIPPDAPSMRPIADEYRAAIASSWQRGRVFHIPRAITGRTLAPGLPPVTESGTRVLWSLARTYPLRYAKAMVRSALLLAGFPCVENAIHIYRDHVLAPVPGARLDRGRAPLEDILRPHFQQVTSPGLLQRFFWSLRGVFDVLVVSGMIAAALLLVVGLIRRDGLLIALAGTPVVWVLAHSLALLAITRYAMPVYPFALACNVVAVSRAASLMVRGGSAAPSPA